MPQSSTPTFSADVTPPPSRPRLAPVPQTDPPTLWPGKPEQTSTVSQGQQVLSLGEAASWWTPRGEQVDPAVAARPSTDHDLDDPVAVCRTLAGAMVEVLSGRRPVAQLTRWTTKDVHRALARRASLVARLRPAERSRPAVVSSTHLCRPAQGVVEACAVVIDNGRVRALAFRLEGWDRRWRVTAAEIG